MQLIKIKKALISVSDKTNLKEILECLKINNIEIISTGGSYKFIKDLGFQCTVGHDGYQERFKILHERQITLFKNKSHIEGIDNLNCKNLENKNLTFSVRFHIHPDIRITKTMGNDILLSSTNGEGWIFRSPQIPTKIEKNLYFGNPNNIRESSFILLEGNIENENTNIIWHLEKAK